MVRFKDELLAPSDAAPILGVSVNMVRVLNDLGRLPALKTPTGRRLFLRSDVEAYAAVRAKAKAAKVKGRKRANVPR